MDIDHVAEEEFKKEDEDDLTPKTPPKLVLSWPYCLSNVTPLSEASVPEHNHVHLNIESPQNSILKRTKVKKSRYRPKIDDETKIQKIKITKPKTKRRSSNIVDDDGIRAAKVRKYVESANSEIPATDHIFHEKTCRRSLDLSIVSQNLDLCQHEDVNGLQQQYENFSQEENDEERAPISFSFSFKWDDNFNLPPQDFEICAELKKIIHEYKRNISSINGGDDMSYTWMNKKSRLKRKGRVSFDKLNDMIAEICCSIAKGNKVGISKRLQNSTHSSAKDFTPLLVWSIFKKKRTTVGRRRSVPLISPHSEANSECHVKGEKDMVKSNTVESCHPRPNNTLQISCSEDAAFTISRNLAMPDFVTCENGIDTHTQNGIEDASVKLSIDVNDQQLGPPLIGDENPQAMTLYRNKNGALVPHKKKKHRLEVDIDQDTEDMWKLLTENGERSADEIKEIKESEEWRKRREKYRELVEEFISLMNEFQGHRGFTPWKTTVIESILGVFLTQNVTDNLSSSAFMNLRARYPAKPKRNDKDVNGERTCTNAPVEETNYAKDELREVHKTSPHGESFSTACKIGANGHQEKSDILRETLQSQQNDFLDQFCDHPSVEVQSNPVEKLPSSSTSEEIAHRKSKNKVKSQPVDWDELRRTYSSRSRDRTDDSLDSIDWDAIRKAPLDELQGTIKKRGQFRGLCTRIKALLERLVKDHGSTDLEWLRDVPPEKAKEFLLSIDGLGLKSVECIRLLTLHHKAFPVDTNVARVAVRLGWIPLKPLPKDIQFHALSDYPPMDEIQKYLWPRLCTLDQSTLYELHYQMISFGKICCTKKSPSCNICPKRAECKHKASKDDASFLLPGPQHGSTTSKNPSSPGLASSEHHYDSEDDDVDYSEPLISLSQEEALKKFKFLNEPEELIDIEDLPFNAKEDADYSLNLNDHDEEFLKDLENIPRELVTIHPVKDSKPKEKLKNKAKLRTEHQVFELPDDHQLLANFNKREVDDPNPYLFAVTTIGKNSNSSLENNQQSELNQSGTFTKDNIPEVKEHDMVYGTILHPCRTALRGNFPLSGTYFQLNEVFVDFASSQMLIGVPGYLVCDLPLRTLYCGQMTTSIVKGFSEDEIRSCFNRGFICVRAFDNDSGAPRNLPDRFHRRIPTKGKVLEWW